MTPPWEEQRPVVGWPAGDRCGVDWIRDRAVECAAPDEVLKLSDAAWARQAIRVAERSRFYRRKFAVAGASLGHARSVADLPALPFTTKQELRDAQDEQPGFGTHLAVDPDDVKVVYQTSGTSGRPSILALTRNDVLTWQTIGARSYFATGIHPHHSVLTTFGAGPFVAGHTHGVLDAIGARRFPVAPGDTERVLAAAQLGLVDTLLTTPSFALHLAAAVEQRDIEGPSLGLRHIVTGGEPGGGLVSVRRRIEDAFHADVTEAMGLGDISPSLYGECPMKGGMHFCGQALVWVELIDPDTRDPLSIEAGAIGEPVYTSLVREAMPLIRFRSGDVVEIGTSCPCGRTGFRQRVLARVDDMFIVRGVNVYPSAVQAVVGEFRPQVTGRIRCVLEGESVSVPAPVLIHVEVPEDRQQPPGLAVRVADEIRSRLLFRSRIEFVPQSSFGDAGYKTKPVVRVPLGSGAAGTTVSERSAL